MNPKIKNSETPYFSTSPVQDQFGQLIVAFGITKREKMAWDIFLNTSFKNSKSNLTKKSSLYGFGQYPNIIIDLNDIEQINDYVKSCYELADKFLNYEDKSEDNTSNIIV
jgi:hypothetical protein